MGAKSMKIPDPPPVQNPDPGGQASPGARAAGATVRVGGDKATDPDDPIKDFTGFTEKRTTGKALGGLGRGGLTL